MEFDTLGAIKIIGDALPSELHSVNEESNL